jgi:hypothetical protein
MQDAFYTNFTFAAMPQFVQISPQAGNFPAHRRISCTLRHGKWIFSIIIV